MAHSKDDDDHYTDDLLPFANENAISTASSLLPLNNESEFPHHDEDGFSSLVGPMGHHQMNHTTTPTTNSHCSNNIPIFIKELLNEKDQTICKYIWSNPVHCGEISQEETSTIEPSHNTNTIQKNCDAFISELYKTIMAKKFEGKNSDIFNHDMPPLQSLNDVSFCKCNFCGNIILTDYLIMHLELCQSNIFKPKTLAYREMKKSQYKDSITDTLEKSKLDHGPLNNQEIEKEIFTNNNLKRTQQIEEPISKKERPKRNKPANKHNSATNSTSNSEKSNEKSKNGTTKKPSSSTTNTTATHGYSTRQSVKLLDREGGTSESPSVGNAKNNSKNVSVVPTKSQSPSKPQKHQMTSPNNASPMVESGAIGTSQINSSKQTMSTTTTTNTLPPLPPINRKRDVSKSVATTSSSKNDSSCSNNQQQTTPAEEPPTKVKRSVKLLDPPNLPSTNTKSTTTSSRTSTTGSPITSSSQVTLSKVKNFSIRKTNTVTPLPTNSATTKTLTPSTAIVDHGSSTNTTTLPTSSSGSGASTSGSSTHENNNHSNSKTDFQHNSTKSVVLSNNPSATLMLPISSNNHPQQPSPYTTSPYAMINNMSNSGTNSQVITYHPYTTSSLHSPSCNTPPSQYSSMANSSPYAISSVLVASTTPSPYSLSSSFQTYPQVVQGPYCMHVNAPTMAPTSITSPYQVITSTAMRGQPTLLPIASTTLPTSSLTTFVLPITTSSSSNNSHPYHHNTNTHPSISVSSLVSSLNTSGSSNNSTHRIGSISAQDILNQKK